MRRRKNCYNYKIYELCDLEGRTILSTYENNILNDYIFGIFNKIEKDLATILENSKFLDTYIFRVH